MSRLDDLLHKGVARGDAPGFVAMVADGRGPLFSGAVGGLGGGHEFPMPENGIFWLASLTKLVTSVAAMQLVQQGRLELDAPVGSLLPELADPQVLTGFDGEGRPQLRPALRPITLRHLLTHMSGIGYDAMNPDLMRARGPEGSPPHTSVQSLQGPLVFDPGDGWEYGFGADWAGLAIEAVSGQPLDAFFKEHVFQPLGMVDTGFFVPEGKADRVAGLHVRTADGCLEPMPSPVAERTGWEFFSGGAGLLGTAADYMRLLRALLNGGILDGSRILSAATVAEMVRNQTGKVRAGRVNTAVPELYLPFDLFPNIETRWGLSALINLEPVPGRRGAGSFGWAGAINCYFWVDPAAGLCAVLMAQVLPFGDQRLLALLRDFEAGVYASFGHRR